jgi:hypothetical protein
MNRRREIKGLVCSQDQFELLHEQLDHTRATSETVRVDRAALAALLMDHSKLINQEELRQ